MGPSSKFDVDGALFHSFPGPGGEVKEHLLCSCRRVPVPLHDNNLTLPRHLGCLFTTNDRRHHRRTSGTPSTITQVRSTARRSQTGIYPEHQLSLLLSFPPLHITTLRNQHNNDIKMWQQIKDLFRACFGERDTIEQPARPRNPTRPALRRSSFDWKQSSTTLWHTDDVTMTKQ